MPSNAVRQPDDRQRAEQALRLRIEGNTYAVIAAELGWSDESGARHAITRLLDHVESETADEYRKIQTARLEGLVRAYLPAALSGNVDAARVVLATHDRLTKLHGWTVRCRSTSSRRIPSSLPRWLS